MSGLATLGAYLQKNPVLMENRILLQGVLRDIFPHDKLTVNLLLIGFDEDIFSLVGTNYTELQLTKLVGAIVNNHGVGEENAIYIIETWLGVVFQESLPAAFGNVRRQHNNHSQSVPQNTNVAIPLTSGGNCRLSVADVREIFFRNKERLMRKCHFSRSQDMGTWDVVNMYSNNHYSRSLSPRERGLLVKKLGKGHYQEADFAYIRTKSDMTTSWGLTYDSIIISALKDLMIPFADIDYAEWQRGFFTDTMTIVLKDGSLYELDEHQMMATPVYDNISDLVGFLNVIKEM